MFEIIRVDDSTVTLIGRLDASQEAKAAAVLDTVEGTTVLGFADLRYLASAGLGMLLSTQKRLKESGHGLKIINMNFRIREIFELAGFHQLFDIE